MKHQPMGSVLIPGDRAPTKYMDLLFVALMSPMKIAGAVFSNASQDILNCCPNTKGATIWYDKCLFKYRNEGFFGRLDLIGVGDYSPNNVSESIISFNKNRNNLWSQLANETLGSQNLYAMGSSELNRSSKLSGLS
jgi:hypothetical protein